MDPQRMMTIAARAADELRAVLDGPLDEIPPTAFSAAIGNVVAEAREMSDIDLRLDMCELVDEVEPAVGREIVAVVREALNNTRKHSGAQFARVECTAADGQVEVCVIDDGHGFDPHTVREGMGMRCSMRERMARCGGAVAIASTPGRGVLVRITGQVNGSRVTESVA
jgi:signal transduction histidine kinase